MGRRTVIVGIVVVAAGWWWYQTEGLQNKADNQSREAMREVMGEMTDERVEAEMVKSGIDQYYSDVDVSSEGYRTVVYTYTFRSGLDPTLIELSQFDDICGDDSMVGQADLLLPSMERAGITEPQVRIDFENAVHEHAFSCSYP